MGYIIKPVTAEVTSEDIEFIDEPFPYTVEPVGTLGAIEVAVYVVDMDSSATPKAANFLYDADGVAVTLTATSQPLTIPSPITLRFVKPVTVATAGVRKVTIGKHTA